MFRPSITLFSLVLVLALAGCGGSDSADVNSPGTPTGTAAPAKSATFAGISYGQGFFGQEQDNASGKSWRWMEGEGTIKLENPKKDMNLQIMGDAPVNVFPKQPPVLTIKLNGEQLDQFTATPEVNKTYTVPAAKLGSGEAVELKISTDKTFVPKEINKETADARKLGFMLRKLTWEPK
jgi:hypothetical protein